VENLQKPVFFKNFTLINRERRVKMDHLSKPRWFWEAFTVPVFFYSAIQAADRRQKMKEFV
jgi:hypothetical protein